MRAIFLAAIAILAASPAAAFCGFYVAKADGDLFNQASKVVYAREGDRSVITMVSDYEGAPSEFAMVVPTPSVLARGQINVGDDAVIEHLDAYTAPRLVEYFDPDPCRPVMMRALSAAPAQESAPALGGDALGVTVEAEYAVGEYDIQILSATESDGLAVWLRANGYQAPEGAEAALAGYIDMGMKFFVAKVNLEAHEAGGGGFLRPLQIAFESPDFMLPIRLGMLNAAGPQDLILMTLTRAGRVETANYLTIPMPTDLELPLFVEDEFAGVYRAGFDAAIARAGGSGVIMEYAWDMAWCDPCAADPLPREDLIALGAWWLLDQPQIGGGGRIAPPSPAQDVFVTRLHARYDGESFKEDLMLRVTQNRENYQGRYVLRHPYSGDATCEGADRYFASLPERFEQEAKALARFTGWDLAEIRAKMKAAGQDPDRPRQSKPWWERMWRDE